MKQYNVDPTKPQEFHELMEFSRYDPPEYVEHSFVRLKTSVGMKLYELLEQMTCPVVVELEERLPDYKPVPSEIMRVMSMPDSIKAEIVVKLTPVRHRDVVYQNVIMESYKELQKPKTFIEKLRFVFGK